MEFFNAAFASMAFATATWPLSRLQSMPRRFGRPFVKRFALCYLTCPVCNVGVLRPNSWAHHHKTCHAVRPRPWPYCVRWGPSPPSQRAQPPIFGPYALRPNGCMDQDATWYGCRPRHRRFYVRWAPRSPSPKRGRSPSPIFGPFLLWPNGWIHQHATWYGGRPQPRGICVRWGSSTLPKKGAELPKFSAHVYCGQTAGWIKIWHLAWR